MALFSRQQKKLDDTQAYESSGELFPKDPSQRADFHSNALASPNALVGVTDPLGEKTNLPKAEMPAEVFGLPGEPTKTTKSL